VEEGEETAKVERFFLFVFLFFLRRSKGKKLYLSHSLSISQFLPFDTLTL